MGLNFQGQNIWWSSLNCSIILDATTLAIMNSYLYLIVLC